MKTKYFINLTTGIEALEDLHFFDKKDLSFVRIQSSHCEASAYEEILLGLDANFLMYLALGYTCVVVDYGAQSHTSKASRLGMEWIRFFLNRLWLNKRVRPKVHQVELQEIFYEQYTLVSKKTKNRLKYFRKFINTDSIRLISLTKSTMIDGHNDKYISILNNFLNT